MTWSYGPGYWTENGDEKQLAYYEDISDTVDALIITNDDIAGFIPTGTAIQNLRTSSLGNDITRDDTHLTYGIGRYTAALTWAKYFTDLDLSLIDGSVAYKGDRTEYEAEIKANIDLIKEAVSNAIIAPLKVTASENTSAE